MSNLQPTAEPVEASPLIVRTAPTRHQPTSEKKSISECLAAAAEIRAQLADRQHSDSTALQVEDRQR